jgi:hypothetical protein
MDKESVLDNTLTERLDRLERESRHLKFAGAVLLLALAVVGVRQVLPRAVPKVIEAEESLILRDAKGNIVAALNAAGPALYLFCKPGST